MRDRAERVCSFYWDMEASLPPKDKQIELAIGGQAVERRSPSSSTRAAGGARAGRAQPLNIKVLVNFAPQNYDAAALRPLDTLALWCRSCAGSRASRSSENSRWSRSTCRNSACCTARKARTRSIFRRWARRSTPSSWERWI